MGELLGYTVNLNELLKYLAYKYCKSFCDRWSTGEYISR